MAERKPRHRSGYRREETEQVEAALLTVAVTTGALMDQICIVGGLVPSLLIDRAHGLDPETEAGHPGTNDLDVGLAVALLDDGQYTEMSERLRQEDFGPDKNEKGNPTPQRWKHESLNVTIDFLLPPLAGIEEGRRTHPLEGDLSAIITPGLQFAHAEREEIAVAGHTLKGERAERTIPVCGPAAFVILKALAFHDRGEPKDAFDLVYVLRRWPDGIADIVERLGAHLESAPTVVRAAFEQLASDFDSPDSIGPQRAAEFDGDPGGDLDAGAADAHGYVDDLLRKVPTAGFLDDEGVPDVTESGSTE